MKKAVFAICILSMLLIGCGPSGPKNEEDYRIGEKGLEISIVPNSIPSKIYGDDQNINIIVEAKNSGAGTIKGGKLHISGFDETIITGMAKEKTLPELEGKSMYNPIGDFELVTFEGASKLAGKDFDTYNPTFLITACYKYDTIASAPVCIDGDPFSITNTEETCKPVDVKMSGGQGAPIAVTGIDVSAMKGKTRFVIHIENAGNGKVFDKSSTGCSPYSKGIDYDDQDMITIDDVTLSSKSIKSSCKIDNSQTRLIEGKRTVFCEADASETAPAYTTPLTIKMSYGYRQSISKSVEILKAP